VRSSFVAALSIALALAPGCYRSTERGRDAGPLADGGVRHDAGTPGDAAGRVACDEESLTEPTTPCSDAVNACRDACGPDEPCRDACFDDACRACVFGTIFHCANEAGCEPLWHEFACCVESVPMCSELQGFDRTRCATSCPMRFEPYSMCIESMGGEDCFRRAARNCHLR
jgi:hypothetical protein